MSAETKTEIKNERLFHTMNIMVANILLTYGFELKTFTHVIRRDGKASKEFWFSDRSPDCEYNAEQVAGYATKDHETLEAKDADHPILWMRALAMNRNQLIEIIKGAPRMVEITNGDRSALISESASEETRKTVASLL